MAAAAAAEGASGPGALEIDMAEPEVARVDTAGARAGVAGPEPAAYEVAGSVGADSGPAGPEVAGSDVAGSEVAGTEARSAGAAGVAEPGAPIAGSGVASAAAAGAGAQGGGAAVDTPEYDAVWEDGWAEGDGEPEGPGGEPRSPAVHAGGQATAADPEPGSKPVAVEDDLSVEGLGLADLLAGALAAYRAI